MAGPLFGIRIVEVGHMLAGPYCGMLLGDLGAEIIKVEGPDGDISRGIGPHYVGVHNTYFASLNRNKKSVVLDLGTVEGKYELHQLLTSSHAMLTNLRPAAIKKLGLTYDVLKHINPKLVCLALTGYGLEGPFANSPAYDYVIQAMTGILQLTGEPGGPPVKPGYSSVDNSAGIMGALGLAAKLVEGQGGQIDVSMHDVMLSQLNYLASSYLNASDTPKRVKGGGHPYIVPAQIFPAQVGYIVLFITHDKFWKIFAEALEEPVWLEDPRFTTMQGRSENRELVTNAIAARMEQQSAEYWAEKLAPLGIVAAAVQSLKDSLDGPLVASRNMVIDIPVDKERLRLIANPIHIDGFDETYHAPPLLGEHNAMIVTEAAS